MDRIRATDYHELVKPSDPQLSPDGERVAFVRSVPKSPEEYEATIYVASMEDEPRQFTAEAGVDSQPRFSPSGDRLAFCSTREEDDRPQLWVMPTDGGEARQITNVIGGIDAIVWSPDGERIGFTQRSTEAEREAGLDLNASTDEEYERETPDPRVIDRLIYRADAHYFDATRSHVYTVNPDTEEVTRHTEGERDFSAPEFGDPETLYYAVCREPDPDDSIRYTIESVDLPTGAVEEVVETTGWIPEIAATPEGKIAYPYTPEEKASMRQTELEVFDPATDETVSPTTALDRTIDPTSIAWDGEDLLFLTPDEGHVKLRRAPATDAPTVETLVAEGTLTGLSGREGRVAFVRSEWDYPGDVFVSDENGLTRLTELNADYLDSHSVSEPEELRFESESGIEVQGWVLTPPEFDRQKRYPLAVEIHGGPHAMWSTAGTMWHEFQTLAARGYVVFWCNPRGSVGYGEAFSMAIEADWGAVTGEDVLVGADRVTAREYVDSDDQFVTGGSFGGFMTAWLVGHTDRFRGAVAQRGVYDLASFYGSTDAFKLVEWDFGVTPWDDPAFLWEQSPVAHADRVTTPTLVVHSDDDFRVPVNNGELFSLALRKHGVDTRLVRYAREGHELSRSGEPGHVVDRLERIARWFDGYSTHHDAPRALDRGDDGLSGAADDE